MKRESEDMTGKREKKPEMQKRQWLVPAACVTGSVMLYAMLSFGGKEDGIISRDGRIYREGYGGDAKTCQVLVDGLEDEPVEVTVTVAARTYTRKEAQTVFVQVMDRMEETIRGENESLMEVCTDLKLPSQIPEYGIRLRWFVSDPEYLDASGKLCETVDKETLLTLSVQLSAVVTDAPGGRYRENYEMPVRLVPAAGDEVQKRIRDFLNILQNQDEEQRTQEWLMLPDTFEGKSLHYQGKKQGGYETILFLGVLLAVLWRAKEQNKTKEEEKKRERELLLDYADVLSKLMVLNGAGLTIRNAWERMVQDYEAAKQQGRQKKRAAYEEMLETCQEMQGGIPEGQAYRNFGRRCRLRPYLKLSSLLEQNRRTGMKNLQQQLQAEMADALEQRKNLALQLGEEAGTKLLLPLFLMLGIIMVMIMVPAMMTMG